MRERALSKDEKIALYEDMLGITEDRDRYARLRDTHGMSPGATWLLSRLVAAKGRWLPKLTLLDAIPSPAEDDDRDLSAVKVRVHEIRKTLGRAAVEWDREMGYRLSSAARDRLDRDACHRCDMKWPAQFKKPEACRVCHGSRKMNIGDRKVELDDCDHCTDGYEP